MRWLDSGLAVLSAVSLIVTVPVTNDVQREQEIVASIIKHLPTKDLDVVEELSGDLCLQRRLAILLVLNFIGTAGMDAAVTSTLSPKFMGMATGLPSAATTSRPVSSANLNT